jgi:hypothetical protein
VELKGWFASEPDNSAISTPAFVTIIIVTATISALNTGFI